MLLCRKTTRHVEGRIGDDYMNKSLKNSESYVVDCFRNVSHELENIVWIIILLCWRMCDDTYDDHRNSTQTEIIEAIGIIGFIREWCFEFSRLYGPSSRNIMRIGSFDSEH